MFIKIVGLLNMFYLENQKTIDIASSTYFVAFAAQITSIESVDIRLLHTSMKTIKSK